MLEAVDNDNGDGATLDGVYGSAGSGGAVVTGSLEYDAESGVFFVEYVPFVAGTHLLSVTHEASASRHMAEKTYNKGRGWVSCRTLGGDGKGLVRTRYNSPLETICLRAGHVWKPVTSQ